MFHDFCQSVTLVFCQRTHVSHDHHPRGPCCSRARISYDEPCMGAIFYQKIFASALKKKAPRWRWHAIDHATGAVLAYVFGRRKDEVFLQWKALLEPVGLTRFYTDHWGAYTRHLEPDVPSPGKRNTQNIERKHLTLRTRIKRLVRKTICFSKSTPMHDIVIGLFVHRYAFGRAV